MFLTAAMLLVIVLSYVLMFGLVKFASRIIDREAAPKPRGAAPSGAEGERKFFREMLESALRN